MHDIILIDKPSGITSFDVIRILQRVFREKKRGHTRTPTFPLQTRGIDGGTIDIRLSSKVDAFLERYIAKNSTTEKLVCGHAGTLDPMASGLLIVGVGEGTKKLDVYLKLPKIYEAEILLGVRTDTGDITGNVLEEREVAEIDPERIRDALGSMVGTLELPVPAYSAVKQKGEPLYKKARRGERVKPPVKPMQIISANLYDIRLRQPARAWRAGGGSGGHVSKDVEHVVVKVRFEVGSGTYIRSLAEELGRRLGYPATLKALRRTKIGEFDIKDASAI